MGEKEPSYIAGGNVNYYNHYGKQYGSSSKKLNIELPYDPAIPLLGIYLKEYLSQVTINIPAHPCLLQHYPQ
jgi:hypothetical protein